MDVFNPGNPVVPSITTALGSLDKPGIRRWERQQVAAYAVTHVDELLARSEEVGYRYLMAVPKILTPEKADELRGVDLWSAAEYALDEAADTGTWIHEYIENDLNGGFPGDPVRDDHYQMVEAYHDWKDGHDIEVIATERTVYGDGYAGTGDVFLRIDGVIYCLDWKSSAAVRETHIAQIAAVGAAHSAAREVPEGTEGAYYHKLQPKVSEQHGGQVDSWWVPEPLPAFQAYGIVQVRPADYDNRGTYIEPFCKLHTVPQGMIDAGYRLFRSALDARLAQKGLKDAMKATGWED